MHWNNKKRGQEKPLKDAIEEYLKAFRLSDKMEEQHFYSEWENAVGTPIARRTTRLKLHGNKLYLEMNSSVMRDQLASTKTLFINKINEHFQKEIVKDIFFQ